MSKVLISVENLSVEYPTENGVVHAVRGLNLELREGEILGLVGESGCGKSATLMSILRLLPSPGKIVSGKIKFQGRDLISLSEKQMRSIRGKDISIVFQNPMSALNPAHRIGDQIIEALKVHGLDTNIKQSRNSFLVKLLEQVGIPSPETVLKYYPHQLSGGMQQRVVIAIALACRPKVILADEPTTSLDVTLQAQILDLIKEINKESGTAVILVTHDLAVASQFCDKIKVMYAGQIVEEGSTGEVIFRPLHPYTRGLLNCIPRFEKGVALTPIPGQVPDLLALKPGCSFYPRCAFRQDVCKLETPRLVSAGPSRKVRCRRWAALMVEDDASQEDESRLVAVDDGRFEKG